MPSAHRSCVPGRDNDTDTRCPLDAALAQRMQVMLSLPRRNHIRSCGIVLRTAPAVLQVKATRDIEKGEELMFSYGSRSSTEFCAWYGFVPLRNVRDDVVLFRSIDAAITWLPDQSGLRRVAGHYNEFELRSALHRIGTTTRCVHAAALLAMGSA